MSCGDNIETGIEPGPPVERVLFIGNSYTYVNDLPAVFAQLSLSKQSSVHFAVDSYAVGGQTWEGHNADPLVAAKIAEGWDFVVLQDQSSQPWDHPGVKPALLELNERIAASLSKPVLFMTWARARDIVYPPDQGDWSRLEQEAAVARYYDVSAEAISATVAPVGRAWERALRDHSVRLHADDGSHPNAKGTYLAACVLFETLAGQSPAGFDYDPRSVAGAEAEYLQAAATQTIEARRIASQNSQKHWDLGGSNTSVEYDIVTSDNAHLGDSAGPDGSPGTATQVRTDKKSLVIPYFSGIDAAVFTLEFDLSRPDWTQPLPHSVLVEKFGSYEISMSDTTLYASAWSETAEFPGPMMFDVATLSPGWHHIALSNSMTTFAVSIDDNQVGTLPTAGPLRTAPGFAGLSEAIYLGGFWGDTWGFDGLLANVAWRPSAAAR